MKIGMQAYLLKFSFAAKHRKFALQTLNFKAPQKLFRKNYFYGWLRWNFIGASADWELWVPQRSVLPQAGRDHHPASPNETATLCKILS